MSTDSPSTSQKHPRPSIVTLACVFVAVTAFLTLTELITSLMDWATVDMQTWLRPILRQLAATGVAVTMVEFLRYLRWFFLAMVPFSVAAMVFAVYALRGDRTARVMTTILAVAAGVVSLPIGIFGVLQATMLFLAAGALWTSDARRWYRGEPALEEAPDPSTAPPGESEAAATASLPAGVVPNARPTSVMTAGLLTILGSLVAGGLAGLYLLVTTFAREAYVEAFESSRWRHLFTQRELEQTMQVAFWVSIVILPLALIGLYCGGALLSQRPAGRRITMWWAAGIAIVGLFALPLVLLGIAVIVLLLRDDARQWTASR